MATMIDAQTTEILRLAAIKASRTMGDHLLKMSCFVSNWSQQEKTHD